MVDFNTDYRHGMEEGPLEKINLSTKDLGISMGIGDPWVQLKSAITAGASHVELGFMGMGKGSISQPTGVTPGSISKDKREDIRQMAKVNNVTLSTHASANVMGFSGLDRNKFSQEKAAEAKFEVKRAVDFAADTTEGGPVVVHTAEFPRAVTEIGKEFESYEGEVDKAMLGLVDSRTGEIKATITRDLTIPRLKVEKKDGVKVPVVDKNGDYIYEEWGYKRFVDEAKKQGVPAERLFFQEYSERERLRANAEEKRWAITSEETKKKYDLVKDRIDSVRALAKKDKAAAKHAAEIYGREMGAEPSKDNIEEYRKFKDNPQEYIEKSLKHFQREYDYARDNFEASGRQRKEIERQQTGEEGGEPAIQTLKEYGLKRSAKNIADLGMYALEVEKKKKLKNPLYIAPENVFPEHYGSHPQELKELILKSREQMAKVLIAKKKVSSKQEARKIAEEHIKATFDVGHANIWRKYFKGDDKKFREWFNKEVKDLIKHKIIGHVHLADNFGYADEHLTPGQGNAPIEDFLKEFKKSGIKDKIIIEPGSQGEGENIYSSMLGAWAKVAGSPMYRVGNVSKSWTDIEGGYFGRTFTPNYMAGGYLVNPQAEENWWSGVPLE